MDLLRESGVERCFEKVDVINARQLDRILECQVGERVTIPLSKIIGTPNPVANFARNNGNARTPEATPKTILDYINRLERLLETAMHTVDLRDIRPSMINFCSRLAEKMTVYQLRRLSDDKRWSLVFSLLGRDRWCDATRASHEHARPI